MFVQGGTHRQPLRARRRPRHARRRPPRRPRRRAGRVAVTGETHSSVKHAAARDGRRRASRRAPTTTRPHDRRRAARPRSIAGGGDGVFAVVATAGTHQPRHRRRPRRHRRRLPPSAACGCTSTAPTAAPRWPRRSVRDLFAGIERADSFIVDPHKWLFAPFDCCALLYRDPALARAAHTQQAGYLDVAQTLTASGTRPTSPSTSPAAPAGCRSGSRSPMHGTDAYTEAIEQTLDGGPGRDRGDPQPHLRRAAARARPVGGRVPPHRLDAASSTASGRTSC